MFPNALFPSQMFAAQLFPNAAPLWCFVDPRACQLVRAPSTDDPFDVDPRAAVLTN